MKKIYAFILFAVIGISAFAEIDDNYYWFFNKVEASPTGKGVIYASDGSVTPESESDYVASLDVKFNAHSSYGSIYAWAKPAAGYQLAGWFTSATDETTMAEKVADGEEASIAVTTEVTTDNDTQEYYPFDPDATYYAIFAKVKVNAAAGLEDVAELSISKVANDTGDKITLTATPYDAESVQFDYWSDSKGNKITENPYTLTVSGVETYTAHFKGDGILTIDFGEGKYIPFSNECSTILNPDVVGYRIEEQPQTFFDDDYNEIAFDETENAWGYWTNVYDDEGNLESSTFTKYEGEIPTFDASYKLSQFGYTYNAGDAVILYSKGLQSFALTPEEEPSPWEGSLLQPTCEGAVNIADLPTRDDDGNAITYYTFNGQDFVKATTGTVAKDQCYLMLTAEQYPQPDKILVANSDLVVGIEAVPAKPAAPQFVGIYTIDGKQVKAPVKGINIVNGKKVWVK